MGVVVVGWVLWWLGGCCGGWVGVVVSRWVLWWLGGCCGG